MNMADRVAEWTAKRKKDIYIPDRVVPRKKRKEFVGDPEAPIIDVGPFVVRAGGPVRPKLKDGGYP